MSEKNESKVPVTAGSECSARLGARTVDDHIADAERWAEELPKGCDPVQMTGWRPTCAVLAEQVAILQFKADEGYEWEMRIKKEAEKNGWNLLDEPLFDWMKKAFEKMRSA